MAFFCRAFARGDKQKIDGRPVGWDSCRARHGKASRRNGLKNTNPNFFRSQYLDKKRIAQTKIWISKFLSRPAIAGAAAKSFSQRKPQKMRHSREIVGQFAASASREATTVRSSFMQIWLLSQEFLNSVLPLSARAAIRAAA
jgi:hypothetical protein